MGSKKDREKKARERFLLDRFLECQRLTPTRIDTPEPPGPDFSLDLDGRKVGIEVTEIYALSPNSDSGVQALRLPQAIEKRSDRIVSLAKKAYFQRNDLPVLVTIVFSNIDAMRNKDEIAELIVREVEDTASKRPETENRRPDFFTGGATRIAALMESDAVPVRTAIISTSLDKYQVLWSVEDFDFDQQEHTLKLLAIAFGGDSACTDRNRVLRVPGFLNCKYDPAHPVTVEYSSDASYHPEDFRLDNALVNAGLPLCGAARAYPTGKSTHSEQDWAWAIQQLSFGEEAGKLTLTLASRRSDKPNPLYYAQRTIDIASARLLLLEGVAIGSVIAMLERRRSTDVPSSLCSSRAREIATTAQRMIARSKSTSIHHPKENHNATA